MTKAEYVDRSTFASLAGNDIGYMLGRIHLEAEELSPRINRLLTRAAGYLSAMESFPTRAVVDGNGEEREYQLMDVGSNPYITGQNAFVMGDGDLVYAKVLGDGRIDGNNIRAVEDPLERLAIARTALVRLRSAIEEAA